MLKIWVRSFSYSYGTSHWIWPVPVPTLVICKVIGAEPASPVVCQLHHCTCVWWWFASFFPLQSKMPCIAACKPLATLGIDREIVGDLSCAVGLLGPPPLDDPITESQLHLSAGTQIIYHSTNGSILFWNNPFSLKVASSGNSAGLSSLSSDVRAHLIKKIHSHPILPRGREIWKAERTHTPCR